jgi:transcriptional regulator with XRE-family HTH domain
MKIPIQHPKELGIAIRATRKAQQVRLDDVAGSAGVGHVFVREVEHGKESVSLGKVMQLMRELGLKLTVEIPEGAEAEYSKLRVAGLRPLKQRRVPSGASTKDRS